MTYIIHYAVADAGSPHGWSSLAHIDTRSNFAGALAVLIQRPEHVNKDRFVLVTEESEYGRVVGFGAKHGKDYYAIADDDLWFNGVKGDSKNNRLPTFTVNTVAAWKNPKRWKFMLKAIDLSGSIHGEDLLRLALAMIKSESNRDSDSEYANEAVSIMERYFRQEVSYRDALDEFYELPNFHRTPIDGAVKKMFFIMDSARGWDQIPQIYEQMTQNFKYHNESTTKVFYAVQNFITLPQVVLNLHLL